MLDTTSSWGTSISRRLETETVAWLTTIRADGSPWPNPVWFVWDGETFLLYSTAEAAKLRHVRRDPRVTLHLNGEGWDEDIVVVAGEAVVSPDDPPADDSVPYLEKYRDSMARLELTPEEYARQFSVALRIRPSSFRGH